MDLSVMVEAALLEKPMDEIGIVHGEVFHGAQRGRKYN